MALVPLPESEPAARILLEVFQKKRLTAVVLARCCVRPTRGPGLDLACISTLAELHLRYQTLHFWAGFLPGSLIAVSSEKMMKAYCFVSLGGRQNTIRVV